MPWTRSGDNAATYPALLSVMGQPGADDRIVNEVTGWLLRCAFQSAAHMTDYLIDVGTAWMLGGSRTQELVKVATRAGLITPATVNGGQGFKLIEDPEFIHIRLRKEVEWERQQRKDTRDPKLRAPVIHRDGDNCRYCGIGVQWLGQTTNRTGTIDHVHPGQAGTVATMVVACKGCNSARQDNPQWDDDNKLWPAPGQPGARLAAPNYGPYSVKYLTKHGYAVEQTHGAQERPATPSDADPAPESVRPATSTAGAAPAPAATRVGQESAEESDPCSDEMTLVGSGRVGSGRVGTGQDVADQGQAGSQPRRSGRRGRRGRNRNRNPQQQQQQPQPSPRGPRQ